MPDLTIEQRNIGKYYVTLQAKMNYYNDLYYEAGLYEQSGPIYVSIISYVGAEPNAKRAYNRYCKRALRMVG